MDPNPYKSPRIEPEGYRPSLYARFARLVGMRPNGRCSFCGERKSPMVEGIEGTLICRDCATISLKLIDDWERDQ
jgi:hypothetical protein